jgi:signal transduction histidine kinase
VSVQVGSWANAGRPYRIAAFVTAALCLFGGWGYLYFKSRAGDLRAATEALAALRELKEADSRWNDWLIGMRLAAGAPGATQTAARVRVEPTRIQSVLAALSVQNAALGNALSPATLASLKQALEGKAQAIDAFGAVRASHAAAVAAFDQAAASFATFARERSSGVPPGAMGAADRMRETVLAFEAQPTPAAEKAAREAIAQFATAEVPEAARPELDRLAAAARQALDAKVQEDGRFRDAFFSSTGPRLDSATRAVEQAFGNAVEEAERYRWYLLVYSGLVVLLAAWLALRLTETYRVINRINRKLREANDFLESRVEARTKELKSALDQLKEQEALLIQSEKMSSLGQMVAGVAHEVNTPLAYVKSSLEAVAGGMPRARDALTESERLVRLLQSEQADEAALAQQFAAVNGALAELRGGERLAELDTLVKDGLYGIAQISELVSNLRNFARLDRSKVAEFDLNEGVKSALSIAKNHVKRRTVKQDLGRISKVSCAPSQINQVFLNLITNAAQATPEEGGVIGVRTWQVDPGQVAVEIFDNGHGIPAEVLPKIFDPFFTTKEVGKGTGLGLSICYKIVEGHGGRINVQSRPGVGTRFTVTLPVKPVAAMNEAATA